jgi:two-component system sensor histidine kinase PilS (NtrC family)
VLNTVSQGPADRRTANTAAAGERRNKDRRRKDRRQAQGQRAADSLFGALGGIDTQSSDVQSIFDPGWLAAGDAATVESKVLLREALRLAQKQDSALARVYRTYAAARAVVGVGLVLAVGLGSLLAAGSSEVVAALCLVYALQAVTLWVLPRFGPLAQPQSSADGRAGQWAITIGIDLVAFTALHVLTAGSALNYGALLVLPVLMAGVLSSRLLALGTTACVALMLLVVTWIFAPPASGVPALMLQSGLAGLGLFVITLLAGELAGRLAREELAARGSMELARQQAQLNRLVIEEMADGVLVVDGRLRVRAANPAARALLVDQGLSPPAPFSLTQLPVWAGLCAAVQKALADSDWPEAGQDLSITFGRGHVRTLRMRVRFVRREALAVLEQDAGLDRGDDASRSQDSRSAEPMVVLLLEDVRTAQARIRQEKLAAMGRVSAGIAHEIRNPLAAIAQANALLMEDLQAPEQQRLARMVDDNVQRLKRLVDEVMEVAPGSLPEARVIDATEVVATAVSDWARTAQLPMGPDGRLRIDLRSQPLGVAFDPEHLRRVLVNLLDNAHRHASALPGAMFLRLAVRDENTVWLSVLSDSPPISPDVERHLFEPFFSFRSRGTGLGLYICRELCARYGASIEYRPRPTAERLRNEFRVTLARAPLMAQTTPAGAAGTHGQPPLQPS